MDYFTILSLSILTLIFGVSFYFLRRYSNQPEAKKEVQDKPKTLKAPSRVGGVRVRRAVTRGGNRRVLEVGDDDDEDYGNDYGNDNFGEDGEEDFSMTDKGKVGVKKAKKLEMKAEKKAMREAMEQEREELKQKQEEKEAERRKKERKRELQEKEEAERQEQLREEQKRKEEEEYQKIKSMFTVDEEGTDKLDEEESENLLQEFIQYIKDQKVVVLEDLAVRFKLKAQEAIDRVKFLRDEGHLTGVMDDRGKFIYVTNTEYQDVARFIKQRGRVSISELSECMNTIINLQGTSPPPLQAAA